MQTPQEIYQQVVSLYDNRESDEAFAGAMITMFTLDARDYYEKIPQDLWVLRLFDLSVNISDGEAAYSKEELKVYWAKIAKIVEKMRAKL